MRQLRCAEATEEDKVDIVNSYSYTKGLQTGDAILFRPTGLRAKALEWLGFHWAHVGMIVNLPGGICGPRPLVIEATWLGVRVFSLHLEDPPCGSKAGPAYTLAFMRPRYPTHMEAGIAASIYAAHMVSRARYGFGMLLRAIAWHIVNVTKSYVMALRLRGRRNYEAMAFLLQPFRKEGITCSALWAISWLNGAGYDMVPNIPPLYVLPDDIVSSPQLAFLRWDQLKGEWRIMERLSHDDLRELEQGLSYKKELDS